MSIRVDLPRASLFLGVLYVGAPYILFAEEYYGRPSWVPELLGIGVAYALPR